MTSQTSRRGTILRIPDTQPGLIHADGQQLAFQIEGVWKSAVAPAVNQVVDIERDEQGNIVSLTVVQSSQLAAEKVRQAAGQLGERGKKAADAAREWAQGPGREKLGQASTAAVQHGQKAYGSFKAWAMSKPVIAKNPRAWAIGAVAVVVIALGWLFSANPQQRIERFFVDLERHMVEIHEPTIRALSDRLDDIRTDRDFERNETALRREASRLVNGMGQIGEQFAEIAELFPRLSDQELLAMASELGPRFEKLQLRMRDSGRELDHKLAALSRFRGGSKFMSDMEDQAAGLHKRMNFDIDPLAGRSEEFRRQFRSAGRSHEGQINAVKAQVSAMATTIEAYYMENGAFPSSLRELVGKYGLRESQLKDPWGNEMHYSRPGRDGRDFDLISYGSDGKPGGTGSAADIGSWQ